MKTTIPAAAAQVIRRAAPPAEQEELGPLLVSLDSMDLVAPSMPRETMRFHAAVAAMQGLYSSPDTSTTLGLAEMAQICVGQADELLKALDTIPMPEPA